MPVYKHKKVSLSDADRRRVLDLVVRLGARRTWELLHVSEQTMDAIRGPGMRLMSGARDRLVATLDALDRADARQHEGTA